MTLSQQHAALAAEVADRVLAWRQAHGLTQKEFGELIGASQPHVSDIERGQHLPSLATLAMLSRVTGMEFTVRITPEAMGLTKAYDWLKPVLERESRWNSGPAPGAAYGLPQDTTGG